MTASARDLWGLEEGAETTAVCWYKRWDGGNPWDGRRPHEETEQVLDRHRQARILCRRCLLLDACERALADMEAQRLHVDGVMAGRYSDVRSQANTDAAMRQTSCRGCCVPLIPRGGQYVTAKPRPGARPHVGEGLCEDCWPWLALSTRRRPPAPPHDHQLNNPLGKAVS